MARLRSRKPERMVNIYSVIGGFTIPAVAVVWLLYAILPSTIKIPSFQIDLAPPFGAIPLVTLLSLTLLLFAYGLALLVSDRSNARLQKQRELLSELKFLQSPETYGMIVKLRDRALYSRRLSYIALAGTIALILFIIVFLVSTVLVSGQNLADADRLTTLQTESAQLTAAEAEVSNILMHVEDLKKKFVLREPITDQQDEPERVPRNFGELLAELYALQAPTHQLEGLTVPTIPEFKASLSKIGQERPAVPSPSIVRFQLANEMLAVYIISLKQYRSRLRSNRILSVEKYNVIEKKISGKKKDNVLSFDESSLQNILTRFGAVVIVLFLTQILVSLYRYSMRLSAFYDSRADVLELAQESVDQFAPIVALMSPDRYDFGKSPRLPTDVAIELARDVLKK